MTKTREAAAPQLNGQGTTPVTGSNTGSSAGTGHLGQTFLVGEGVYLRTFEVGDEKNATSWRNSVFPKSTELMKKWIEEDLPKAGKKKTSYYAIVRKSDDLVVGSVRAGNYDTVVELEAHVDSLYGVHGLRWKAEAITLCAAWAVDERHVPSLNTEIPASETVVAETLLAFGMRECARWREMFFVNGERVDNVMYSYHNKGWMETLGDPMETELPKSGSGEPRPVPPKVTLDGDPPKNAIMVGKRVYLRPEEKADAKQVAEWARKEEETFFDVGRHLPTEVLHQNWMSSIQDEDTPDTISFSVCLRENDEVIGSVNLFGVDYVNLYAETGSWFHRPDYRGSGYGSEAKHLLLEYAFDILGLHMVESWVYFPNTRSAAALRKQGYKEAGRVTWLYPYEGNFGNMVVFDLLAEEWRAMPRGEWNS
jgi:RimJ/RimL family protein N-acetyltransferase